MLAGDLLAPLRIRANSHIPLTFASPTAITLRQIADSHFEIKCVDGLADPYFALAALIGAGLQSVLSNNPSGTKLPPHCLVDPATMDAAGRKEIGIMTGLPRSLEEALSALGKEGGAK